MTSLCKGVVPFRQDAWIWSGCLDIADIKRSWLWSWLALVGKWRLGMACTLEDSDKAFATKVTKPKADIAIKRITGWIQRAHPKISDIFHNSLLDVELIGMRPFIFHGAAGRNRETADRL
jgi:hypothetical protein